MTRLLDSRASSTTACSDELIGARRGRLGQEGGSNGHPAFFDHGAHVLVASAHFDLRSLGVGIEDVNLVETDARVGQ